MTDTSADVALDAGKAAKGSKKLWIIIAAAVLLAGAAGGGWYFFMGRHAGGEVHAAPKPLPFYLDLKPLVVSVASGSGQARYVQVGASLQLSSASAGEQVTAVLPRVQDAMRQTLLTFKAEDLTKPEGVNRAREAIVRRINEVLSEALGSERYKAAAEHEAELVQNIFFPTLVVE